MKGELKKKEIHFFLFWVHCQGKWLKWEGKKMNERRFNVIIKKGKEIYNQQNKFMNNKITV